MILGLVLHLRLFKPSRALEILCVRMVDFQQTLPVGNHGARGMAWSLHSQQCRPLVRNFVGDFWLVSASSEFGENNLKSWHATALSEILSGADDQEGSISAAW